MLMVGWEFIASTRLRRLRRLLRLLTVLDMIFFFFFFGIRIKFGV